MRTKKPRSLDVSCPEHVDKTFIKKLRKKRGRKNKNFREKRITNGRLEKMKPAGLPLRFNRRNFLSDNND